MLKLFSILYLCVAYAKAEGAYGSYAAYPGSPAPSPAPRPYSPRGPGLPAPAPYTGPFEVCQSSPEDPDADCIPGQAVADYPVYDQIPATGFTCQSSQFPGYFADTETQCQVFHVCQPDGRLESFLCPKGTIFNQQYFICDWWYNFDCSTAPGFYTLNSNLYQAPHIGLHGPVEVSYPAGPHPVPASRPAVAPVAPYHPGPSVPSAYPATYPSKPAIKSPAAAPAAYRK